MMDRIARMMAMDAAQQGGGTTDAYTKAETDELLDGKADLVDGKIPAAQLPSYVDDVLEYNSTSAFPATGESGKIYVASDTNRTYRWGGSAYVEISESLALGETASTAYPGNNGKANAAAIAAMKDGQGIDSFGDVETALAGKADVSHTHTMSQITDLGAAAAKGFDASPTSGHTNYAVSSDGVYQALAGKLNTADVDAALSNTSTNPVQNKAVQAPIARLMDAGAKNLLNLNTTLTSHEHRGITYKNNNDGTIRVSGTSNANDSYVTIYDLSSDNFLGVSKGRAVVIASTSDDVSIGIVPKKEGGVYGPTISAYKSSPVVYTIPSDFSGFLLRVGVYKNGTTVNEDVNGMICTAEDYAISPEFVPYAPSNRELYEMILALQSGT